MKSQKEEKPEKPDFDQLGKDHWRSLYPELSLEFWEEEQKGYAQIFAIGAERIWNDYVASKKVEVKRSGMFAKDGREICAGDVVWWRTPYRTTQTHTGDNIPNGSYTEPMEPGIRMEEGEVVFEDGMFGIKDIEGRGAGNFPLAWLIRTWDLESLKDAVAWWKPEGDIFDDPEEGNLQYLMFEVAKVKTPEELLDFLSGIHISDKKVTHQ